VFAIADPHRVAELLGGPALLGRNIDSLADLESLVLEGLPKTALRNLATVIATSQSARTQFIYSVVPEATYKRRRDRLTIEEGERTERLARIAAGALDVWRDVGRSRQFLTSPHPLLDDRAPVEAALTEIGARRVEEILAALECGLPG